MPGRFDVHRPVPLLHTVEAEEPVVQLADRAAHRDAVHQVLHDAVDDPCRRGADLIGELLPVVAVDVLLARLERTWQVANAPEERVHRTAQGVLA